MERLRITIGGESGAGLLSTGDILMNAFRELGFYIVTDREYPSLIKGGHARFSVNLSATPIHGLSRDADIMMVIDRPSLEAYFSELREGGVLVHGQDRLLGLKDLLAEAEKKKISVVNLAARTIAENAGGNVLMINVVLIGMLWKALGLDYAVIEAAVNKKFASKPKLLEIDLRCLKAGYDGAETKMQVKLPTEKPNTIMIDGNKSLALGGIHAGVRAYFAYPMSPSTPILDHFAKTAEKTGVMVKQAEDEITVANMALGAMYMGTRALAATSGGGYDLMTETVSLAGITETPLVLIDAQRPGPATGLPTWTCQGDFNLAAYSSHGEFPRLVIGVSDPTDCFDLIQHAFNYAEKYQIVVVVLTEKAIGEIDMSVPPFEQGKIPIERGLVEGEELKTLVNEDRFKITESGLSKRWVPGSAEAYYFANGDEHWEDGSVTEEADKAAAMYDKRMRKNALVLEALPEPEIYGDAEGADISFVGWGSSRNVMRDVVEMHAASGVKVNYLHFSYVYPLKKRVAEEFFAKNKNVHLIEGNYMGQFGNYVEAELGRKFAGRLLKYNGRPFYLEDLEKYITGHIKENG